MKYPHVLVVSNNSFSKTSSNGRTLGNLFLGWPKDKLAQFCISTTEPDFDVCENYYLLTDRSMLDGFKHLKKGKRCDIETGLGTEGNAVIGGKKVVKTPWRAIIRHLVWSGRRWESKDFKEWVDGFSPEIVVVMNSDATFILDIAAYIATKRDVPLIMFNTEGFYFLKKLFSRNFDWCSEIVLKIYQSIYRRHFRKMMKFVRLSIHLNKMLENDYRNEFGGSHLVLYTGSEVRFDSSNLHTRNPTFTYLGNFGFDRPSVLVEIAEVLQSISTDYRLHIYGKIPSPEIKIKFDSCPGIVYEGMVQYDEVVRVMYESTILFHAEVQTERFQDALRYGFSTKIADSISSGHPFVMYSSSNIAGAKYIIETGAGWFAQNKIDLEQAILTILSDAETRSRVLGVAHRIAEKNHNIEKNRVMFLKAVNSVLG